MSVGEEQSEGQADRAKGPIKRSTFLLSCCDHIVIPVLRQVPVLCGFAAGVGHVEGRGPGLHQTPECHDIA